MQKNDSAMNDIILKLLCFQAKLSAEKNYDKALHQVNGSLKIVSSIFNFIYTK